MLTLFQLTVIIIYINVNLSFIRGKNQNVFIGIQVVAEFPDILAELLYDVLHDPEYRRVWDPHMIEAKDIGCINPNNDVGYYSSQSSHIISSRVGLEVYDLSFRINSNNLCSLVAINGALELLPFLKVTAFLTLILLSMGEQLSRKLCIRKNKGVNISN